MPGKIWLNTLEKKVAAHVLLPRTGGESKPGTAHPSFKISASPPDAVRFKCEQAGIPLKASPHPKAQRHLTIYEGYGPMMAYHFCQTQKRKKYGHGSGALVAPGKFRTDSDTLVFAVPPITVTHNALTWVMTVDFYLCVYNGEGNNQTGRVTLPPNPNQLYGTQDVEALFERTAIHVLGEMRERRFPLSTNFKTILGSDFDSSSEDEEPPPAGALAAKSARATRAKAARADAWTSKNWQAVRLTRRRREVELPNGQWEWRYEVVWSGKWANTWEPASCLPGWEEEMADADSDEGEAAAAAVG